MLLNNTWAEGFLALVFLAILLIILFWPAIDAFGDWLSRMFKNK